MYKRCSKSHAFISIEAKTIEKPITLSYEASFQLKKFPVIAFGSAFLLITNISWVGSYTVCTEHCYYY